MIISTSSVVGRKGGQEKVPGLPVMDRGVVPLDLPPGCIVNIGKLQVTIPIPYPIKELQFKLVAIFGVLGAPADSSSPQVTTPSLPTTTSEEVDNSSNPMDHITGNPAGTHRPIHKQPSDLPH